MDNFTHEDSGSELRKFLVSVVDCEESWLRKERKRWGGINGEKHGEGFFPPCFFLLLWGRLK